LSHFEEACPCQLDVVNPIRSLPGSELRTPSGGEGGSAAVNLLPSYGYSVSIIVVSFNTCDLLRKCLQSILEECGRLPAGVTAEVLVVDNASADGSADMVAREFSTPSSPIRLIRSDTNLGFGVANNLALEAAEGKYLVLLNSDAFFHPGALRLAVEHMEANPAAGIGGARLVGSDGAAQPSARSFPSIWLDALVLSSLADRFPRSRIFGAPDRTWADPKQSAEVDWLPGAFLIARREALARVGIFDPDFFLYYEEVDLCRRVKAAGFPIFYWPDIVVTHLGGESSRQLDSHKLSGHASEVVLWRMRSTFLYYRKHHGWKARMALWLELSLFSLSRLRNARNSDPARRQIAEDAILQKRLLRQAWRETRGGRVSPPSPW
jgi:GT2 family glycosyltransferase